MNLYTLIQKQFGPFKRTNGKNGIELITRCPVCGKNKLTINPHLGVYKCWRGCISGTLKKLFNIDWSKIEKDPSFQSTKVKDYKFEFPGQIVPIIDLPVEHPAVQYLRNRNFSEHELYENYRIMYCVEGKKFANGIFDTTNTIIIPFYRNNEVIGWQSRLLYNPDNLTLEECQLLGLKMNESGEYIKPPKYFTMPGLDKGRILFNYDWAKQSEIVVVCEGVFDAIAVGRCAVAALGKNLSDKQIDILKTFWSLIIILLDPDAEHDAITLENKINTYRTSFACHVTLSGYKDPGEAPQPEIWKQIESTLQNTYNIALSNYRFLV